MSLGNRVDTTAPYRTNSAWRASKQVTGRSAAILGVATMLVYMTKHNPTRFAPERVQQRYNGGADQMDLGEPRGKVPTMYFQDKTMRCKAGGDTG
jgi:hypothetical protein